MLNACFKKKLIHLGMWNHLATKSCHMIKTHSSVSCGPRNKENLGVRQTSVYFTGVKKMPFSRICSSKLPEQKHTKFSMQISSGWGISNSKFELNPPSLSRDMRLQSLSYFLHIFLEVLFLLLFATLFKLL